MRSLGRTVSCCCLLFAVLFLAACANHGTKGAPSDLRAAWDQQVDAVIPEAERAAEIKELGHRLIDLRSSFVKDLEELRRTARELNADHGTPRAKLEELFAVYEGKRTTVLREYRDVVFAIRGRTSAAEWKGLAGKL